MNNIGLQKQKKKKNTFGQKYLLVHFIGNDSQEVKDKLDVILTHAYPLMSQGLGWTDAIEERPDGKGNLHFEVFPKYLSDKSVAELTVCSVPDVIVELSRKTKEQKAIAYHGKYVFFKQDRYIRTCHNVLRVRLG